MTEIKDNANIQHSRIVRFEYHKTKPGGIMEKIIKEINTLGYSVALRQFNKLKVNNECLWEACATYIDSSDMRNHPKHIYMDEITFGRDAAHALGKLRDKCAAAVAAKAAAKKYDPFEDDEEDAPETYEAEGEDAFA